MGSVQATHLKSELLSIINQNTNYTDYVGWEKESWQDW